MWVLKPAGLIILVMLGYIFFKRGKTTEIARGIGRSVGAFKEGLNDEDPDLPEGEGESSPKA